MSEYYFKDDRVGNFAITFEIFEDKRWFLYALQKKIAIIDVNMNHRTKQIEYTGISDLFGHTTKDCKIPWYLIELRNDTGEVATIKKLSLVKKPTYKREEKTYQKVVVLTKTRR